ncbi:MAG: hypothetical protein AB4368_32525 [Xenococcaceae cyanobacterium]
MNLQLKDLNHQKFQDAHQLIEEKGRDFFKTSAQDIAQALQMLYGEQEISLQQLSATFRRGDLIEKLNNLEV